MPAPNPNEPGWIYWDLDADGLYRLRHADPRVRIADEVMELCYQQPLGRLLTVNPDRTITVHDDYGNRYVYRLIAYRADLNCWEARWPD